MIRINFEHFSFQGETAISLSNWMMKVEVQEQTPEFCQNAYKGMLFKPCDTCHQKCHSDICHVQKR